MTIRLDKENQDDHEWRVCILVISIVSILFFFRLHIFITIIPFECWTVSDIWEHKPYFFSPFNSYFLISLLLMIWASVEVAIGYMVSRSVVAKSISIVSMITMMAFLVGLFHFWQHFRIVEGSMDADEYLIKLGNMTKPYKYESYDDFPKWEEFVIQERCDKGKAISSMTEEEKWMLRDKYKELSIRYMKEN